jgi:hypothetical protein
MKISDLQNSMIGGKFAHKADDNTPVSVGKLVRFETINNTIIPVLDINGEEKFCLGVVFEYYPDVEFNLNYIPVSKQYDFLKCLKLSFTSFRDLNPGKYN